uniref:Uncharacterized protein n=1 Tax=Mucochytrium quahogii TaxID=96639 RepID=A0A7S2RMJ2_9STRA|mmetsp:Transcript_13891/g.22676  ORF Transcript_13891/g.22676 Transcript_13891/m.22676 type:complete len:235 (+) Transcript_13891:56-760(+)
MVTSTPRPLPSPAEMANDEIRDKYFADKRLEFEMGCAANHPGACFSLGEWWQLFGKDSAKARELFEENCEKRQHANSCFNLALMYGRGDVTKDKELASSKSFNYANMACTGKNAQACAHVGQLKLFGHGCEKNVDEAIENFDFACDSNDSVACYRLGRLYLDGHKKHGVPRDPKKCLDHMTKSCHLGNPNGCQVVAVMYKKGDGIPQDDKKFEFYKTRTKDIVKQTGEPMGRNV